MLNKIDIPGTAITLEIVDKTITITNKIEYDMQMHFRNTDADASLDTSGDVFEKEKQYLVKIKATKHYLVKDGNGKIFFSLEFKGYFTKKELEEAGFGWVFSCEGIEIEEVE